MASTPALECAGLKLRFGGIHALDDVSLRVEPGEIVGLIGMNGAGKSTLLNCVSGMTGVDSGSITAYGVDITNAPADFRADLGIARTFQGGKLLPTMTVLENVELALERQHVTSTFTAMLGLPWGRQAEEWKEHEAHRLLDLIGLSSFADKFVRELSTGTRRIVELAALLAQRPRLILMDEPAAGVAQRETEVLVLLLQQLRDELDCAIVLVEHDMPLVMAVCDHVYAMEAGRVIADGPPLEVQADPLVVASYLGEEGAAIARSDAAPTATATRARTRARARGAATDNATDAAGPVVPPAPVYAHAGHAGRKSLVLAAPVLALALFATVLSIRSPGPSRPVAETAHQARPTVNPTTTTTATTTTLPPTTLATAPAPTTTTTATTSTTPTSTSTTTTTTTTTTRPEPPPPPPPPPGSPLPIGPLPDPVCGLTNNAPIPLPLPCP